MTAAELEKLLAEVTPGPWRIIPYDAGDKDEWSMYTPMIDGSEEADRAVVHWAGFRQKYWQSADGKQSEIEANAHLIAMAPTLARRVIAAELMAEALRELDRDGDCRIAYAALAAYEAAK